VWRGSRDGCGRGRGRAILTGRERRQRNRPQLFAMRAIAACEVEQRTNRLERAGARHFGDLAGAALRAVGHPWRAYDTVLIAGGEDDSTVHRLQKARIRGVGSPRVDVFDQSGARGCPVAAPQLDAMLDVVAGKDEQVLQERVGSVYDRTDRDLPQAHGTGSSPIALPQVGPSAGEAGPEIQRVADHT